MHPWKYIKFSIFRPDEPLKRSETVLVDACGISWPHQNIRAMAKHWTLGLALGIARPAGQLGDMTILRRDRYNIQLSRPSFLREFWCNVRFCSQSDCGSSEDS